MWTPLPVRAFRYAGRVATRVFSLAGFHFGDLPPVEDHPADDLHVEVAHVEITPTRLPDEGERLGEDILEGLPPFKPLLEPPRFGPHFIACHFPVAGLEGAHRVNDRMNTLEHTVVRRPEYGKNS